MAYATTVEEGPELILKRRAKRRYLSILHVDKDIDVINAITRRHFELFGSIATESAGIRLIKSRNDIMIVKCDLEQVDSVLIAITLAELPAVTIGISGSIKRLQKSTHIIVPLLNR
jgi:RNase P/RNase MRP subunit POP5